MASGSSADKQEWPKKVRTVNRPDEEIEVGEAEYTDLARLGFLKDAVAPADTEKKES